MFIQFPLRYYIAPFQAIASSRFNVDFYPSLFRLLLGYKCIPQWQFSCVNIKIFQCLIKNILSMEHTYKTYVNIKWLYLWSIMKKWNLNHKEEEPSHEYYMINYKNHYTYIKLYKTQIWRQNLTMSLSSIIDF